MTFLAGAPRARNASRFPLVHASPLAIRDETRADIAARDALLATAFGANRHEKTSERLREGRKPARGLSLVATLNGVVVGTVRLWHVDAGEAPALLLGPLAVSAEHRTLGIGAALMRAALRRAKLRGHKAVLLVGDAAYYERFGFARDYTRDLAMPGPVDAERFLGLELEDGALARASGMVAPTGAFVRAAGFQQAGLRQAGLRQAGLRQAGLRHAA